MRRAVQCTLLKPSMRVIVLLVILILTRVLYAQYPAIDRMKALLQTHSAEDTARVNLLNDLSYNYRWLDFTLSQRYSEEALALAKKLDFKKGIVVANCRLAHCLWATGDNELAIEKGLEAAAIAEQLHSANLLGESFQVIARGYMDQRETKKAQVYIHKAEAAALKTNNWDLVSRIYNLAGVILFVKNNKDSALIMYRKALSTMNEHGTSRSQLSQIISNMGECHVIVNLDSGIKYFRSALTIAKAEETRNRSAEAAVSGILGNALIKKKNYQEAEIYLMDCLRIARELGSKAKCAICLCTIG